MHYFSEPLNYVQILNFFKMLNFKNIFNRFKRNGYPSNIIDVYIKIFLNNVFIDKKVNAVPPKNELVCVVPFIEKK